MASVFLFCIFVQKNEVKIVNPVKAEEIQMLPLQPENEIIEKIYAKFGKDGRVATAIAFSESGLKNVKGDILLEFIHEGKVMGHSCGIFQIRVLNGRPTCEELMDVDTNIDYAYKIFQRFGFSPWSNFNNKAYKKFL